MAKKMSAIVLAAVMSVTLLAGCGSKGTDTGGAGDSSAAQTTENQGSTDAGTAGEEGLIPITFSRAAGFPDGNGYFCKDGRGQL